MLITGWLVGATSRPSFSDLESTMKIFSTNPTQYVFTVVSVAKCKPHLNITNMLVSYTYIIYMQLCIAITIRFCDHIAS